MKAPEEKEESPDVQLRVEANRYSAALNSTSRRASVTVRAGSIIVNGAPYSLSEIKAMRRHLESRAAIRW
jgi:hypothetical protein